MKQLETLEVVWTGVRPVIMSNPQTVQISNPYAMKCRELNKKMKDARKKNDENRMQALELEQFRNDWESSAYWSDEQHEFYLPDTAVAACIKAGAAGNRKGKDIDRGLIVNEPFLFFDTGKKFASLDDAYADQNYRLTVPAKIPPKTGALVYKCRCMIPTGWKLNVSLDFDPDFMDRKTLMEILNDAGAICGIGGWRPKFGRFIVEA